MRASTVSLRPTAHHDRLRDPWHDDHDRPLVTAAVAARLLRVDEDGLGSLVDDGEIDAVFEGGTMRICLYSLHRKMTAW